jgi:aryl carrier-like protein
MEQTVAAIWCEVLGVERVGIHDNFFDLGGNSLRIVQLHKRLQEQNGGDLTIAMLFQYPTVSTLVQHMNHKQADTSVDHEIRERTQRQKDAMARQRESVRNWRSKL